MATTVLACTVSAFTGARSTKHSRERRTSFFFPSLPYPPRSRSLLVCFSVILDAGKIYVETGTPGKPLVHGEIAVAVSHGLLDSF